jgi:hypothetical protein
MTCPCPSCQREPNEALVPLGDALMRGVDRFLATGLRADMIEAKIEYAKARAKMTGTPWDDQWCMNCGRRHDGEC